MAIRSNEYPITEYLKLIQCKTKQLCGSLKIYLTRKIPNKPVEVSKQINIKLSGSDILAHTNLIAYELKKSNISYQFEIEKEKSAAK